MGCIVPLSAGLCCFSSPPSPLWHVTHIGPATVHACVRITRSNQNRYNSKTPQVRLRFMFHYRVLLNYTADQRRTTWHPSTDRLRRKSTIKDDSPRPPRLDAGIRLYSLLFVLLSRTPQVTPFLHDPICNRSGCMRNPFRGGVSTLTPCEAWRFFRLAQGT